MIKLIENYQKKTQNLAHRCRFYPSCSNYGLESYKRFNFFKASFLTLFRIIRCNPLCKGGYDPVKEKKAQFIQLDESCYILEYRNNTDRPNIAYIYDSHGSILIDGGNSHKHIKYLYKEIKKRNLPLPKYSIVTHYHWDHTFGLFYTNTESIGLKKTNEYLNQYQTKFNSTTPKKFIEENIEDFSKDHILLEYKHNLKKIKIKPLDITFEKEYRLYDYLELFEFPSAHTNDSLAILNKKNKMLFLGDSLCGKIEGFEFIKDINVILKQIELLEKIDFEIAVTSHQNPMTKNEIIAYLKEKTRLE